MEVLVEDLLDSVGALGWKGIDRKARFRRRT
jgi:hypothetical protein